MVPSDAKLGTDDPEDEAAQVEGQLSLDDEAAPAAAPEAPPEGAAG